MSLIIASSAQGEFNYGEEGANIGSGIQKPYSFRNHLSNTITIPPNSEVAVTSAQIYRSEVVTILPTTRAFIFHGERDNDKSLIDMSSDIIPIKFKAGTYSKRQAIYEMRRAFSEAFGQHPDLRRAIGGIPPVLVNPANSTDQPVPNPLEGYNFQVSQTPRTDQQNLVGAFATGESRSLELEITGYYWDTISPSQAMDVSVVTAASGDPFTITRAIENLNNDNAQDFQANCQIINAPIPQNGVKDWDGSDVLLMYDVPGAISITLDGISGEGGFDIGLSRPTPVRGEYVDGNRVLYEQFDRPRWFSAPKGGTDTVPPPGIYAGPFYDYLVRWEPINDRIQLWHSVYVPQFREMRMVEITYWGADGGDSTMPPNPYTSADFTFGGGNMDTINFNVWGEAIQIYITDQGGEFNGVPIMDTLFDESEQIMPELTEVDNRDWTKLGLRRAAKPVNQNCWAMYPKIDLAVEDDFVTVSNYQANSTWENANNKGKYSFNYPSVPMTGMRSWASGEYTTGVGSSWWGRAMKNVNSYYSSIAKSLDTRPNVTLGSVGSVSPRVGMDLTTTTETGGTIPCQAKRFGYGLIIEPTMDADDAEALVFPNNAQYARPLLGFGSGPSASSVGATDTSGQILSPVNLDGTDPTTVGVGVMSSLQKLGVTEIGATAKSVGYGLWKFQSSSPPEMLNSTAFVRVPSLTHQSYNFCKSLPSKILWQIPKFTPDGRSDGSMYFTNPAPIYLDLRNPNPLTLQQLDVDIVDKNEKFCEELNGATTITLHFREKQGHHKC